MSRSYTIGRSAAVCRAALAIRPLTMKINPHGGGKWAFGHRLFSATVVNWLIERGEAVRVGDTVRAA